MDAQAARQLDDEAIDELLRTTACGGANVIAETQRRAEIRVNRVIYGTITQDEAYAKHDAAWYDSRQTEEQWLAEMNGD